LKHPQRLTPVLGRNGKLAMRKAEFQIAGDTVIFEGRKIAGLDPTLPGRMTGDSQKPAGMTRGGKAPREKGDRLERTLVRLFLERGIDACRMPLSGTLGERFAGDITVRFLGRDLRVEVKARKNGFARLYSALNGRVFAVVKSDRQSALVVLPVALCLELASLAESWREAARGSEY
jgi:hypothetical protein